MRWRRGRRGICGKLTSDGSPCRNPPGCTLTHSGPVANNDTLDASREALRSAPAGTAADTGTPPAPETAGKTLVPIIYKGTIEKTLVPQAEYEEWASARDALWGGMADEDLAQNLCAADQMLDRNTAKRLTDMATSFLVAEGGLTREEADERGDRYLRALEGMQNYTEHYSFAELPDFGE